MSKETKDQLRDEIIELKKEINKCKKTENALRKSEQRFRTFAESATDGIVTTDDHGNILFFNNSFKTIFGYSSEEIQGNPLTMVMPDRLKKSYMEKLEHFRSTGKDELADKTIQTTSLKKDGTEFPLELSISTWTYGDESFVSSIMRDVSERKKAEEAVQKSEEKYRYIVEKFLKISNEILQEMNKP
jgi:PAS domain S-box-containing protein